MSLKSSSLRKAAVLIASLDTEAADRLLEQMGDEQATKVRNAILHLGDISEEEQEAALAEFFGHRTIPTHTADEGAIEWQVSEAAASLAERPLQRAAPAMQEDAVVVEQFEFLQHVPVPVLCDYFQREHPQTIALVIAQMTAEQGAALLRSFSEPFREEIIERLESVEETDAEIITEIEQSLRKAFARHVRNATMSSQRREHIQAILSKLAPSPTSLDSNFDTTLPQNEQVAETTSAEDSMEPFDEFESNVEVSIPYELLEVKEDANDIEPKMDFEEILAFTTHDFFAVFEAADPCLVMLALAGASRRMFDRYTAQFSTERAAEFERHLEQLRPFSLRDVFHAQRELAKIAVLHRCSAESAAENSHLLTAMV